MYFDEDTITDQPERRSVQERELIREKALRLLEIPQEDYVVIDAMKVRRHDIS